VMAANTTRTATTRSPRRARSGGERTRAAIVHEAARLATVDGLDGLSLAHLADAVGMSKSGLFAHFGSKEELQLATVEAASAIFEEEVIEPAGETAAGVPRLWAYIERFLDHVGAGGRADRTTNARSAQAPPASKQATARPSTHHYRLPAIASTLDRNQVTVRADE